jgi:predicted membrane protein
MPSPLPPPITEPLSPDVPAVSQVTEPERHTANGLRWPNLLVGMGLMVLISVYPPLLTRASGQADHLLASLLMWAMSAGLVSGVGFVPRWWGWRWLFSGWASSGALLLAAWAKSQA